MKRLAAIIFMILLTVGCLTGCGASKEEIKAAEEDFVNGTVVDMLSVVVDLSAWSKAQYGGFAYSSMVELGGAASLSKWSEMTGISEDILIADTTDYFNDIKGESYSLGKEEIERLVELAPQLCLVIPEFFAEESYQAKVVAFLDGYDEATAALREIDPRSKLLAQADAVFASVEELYGYLSDIDNGIFKDTDGTHGTELMNAVNDELAELGTILSEGGYLNN